MLMAAPFPRHHTLRTPERLLRQGATEPRPASHSASVFRFAKRPENNTAVLFLTGIIRRIDVSDRKRPLAVNLNNGFTSGPSIMVHLRRRFSKAARM
jgi:hypothetical protein